MSKFKTITRTLCGLFAACTFLACSETDHTWDPYTSWQTRNAEWFASVADTARTAIAQAKATYGNAWEDHCAWRMYKTLRKSQSTPGALTDSICVKIAERGNGTYCPLQGDTTRLNYRGWLMPTKYDDGNGNLTLQQRIFTQTYYGTYDPATAAPAVTAVNSDLIDGFSTVLQYMVEGDDWYVYIPQELAYGKQKKEEIPAYSALLFRISMVGAYPAGSGVPAWQARKE